MKRMCEERDAFSGQRNLEEVVMPEGGALGVCVDCEGAEEEDEEDEDDEDGILEACCEEEEALSFRARASTLCLTRIFVTLLSSGERERRNNSARMFIAGVSER